MWCQMGICENVELRYVWCRYTFGSFGYLFSSEPWSRPILIKTKTYSNQYRVLTFFIVDQNLFQLRSISVDTKTYFNQDLFQIRFRLMPLKTNFNQDVFQPRLTQIKTKIYSKQSKDQFQQKSNSTFTKIYSNIYQNLFQPRPTRIPTNTKDYSNLILFHCLPRYVPMFMKTNSN